MEIEKIIQQIIVLGLMPLFYLSFVYAQDIGITGEYANPSLKNDDEKRRELELKIKGINIPAISFNNMPIRDVIEQLANMTGLSFFLDPEVLKTEPKVTFSTVAPLSLWTLLDAILLTVELDFSVELELIRISIPERLQKDRIGAQTNNDERKRKELELKIKSTRVPVISFINAPIKDVIEQLSNMTAVNFFLDPVVLKEKAGEIRTTFRTVSPVSLWTLLETMLRTVDLDFCVEPELIFISTPERIQSKTITKTYLPIWGEEDENLKKGKDVKGLCCSISLKKTTLRVGDPISIDVKIKNVSDKPINIYYPGIYLAKQIAIRDEKGGLVKSAITVDYEMRSVSDRFRLLKPRETIATQISGRVTFECDRISVQQIGKPKSLVVIEFRDVTHYIGRPSTFTMNLHLSADTKTEALGARYGIASVWSGELFSNIVTFYVRLMTREELNDTIETLRNGAIEEMIEATKIIGANADSQAIPILLEIISKGSGRLWHPASDALSKIQAIERRSDVKHGDFK